MNLNYTFQSLDNDTVALSKFKGSVILIVNTASKCGLTPQYDALEALYKKYKDKGLVVLGFPANNFRNQEPGTDEEIKEFCSTKYEITFPVMKKTSVVGDDANNLFKELAQITGRPPEWNFTKYLINKSSDVVQVFGHFTKPDSEEIVTSIEKFLQE